MSRLAPLDRALVLVLVPLWVVCFALALRAQVEGGGTALVGLRVGPDEYPALTGWFSSFAHPSDPLAEAGLREGDVLIRVGAADLRGVGRVAFYARVQEEAGRALHVPVVFERDGERRRTLLPLAPLASLRSQLPSAVAGVAVALFLILRGRATPMLRAFFHSAVCTAFFRTHYPGGELQTWAWLVTWCASGTLYFPLLLRFLWRFPDERVPEGRWHRVWPWSFLVVGAFVALFMVSTWAGVAERAFLASVSLGIVAALAVATRKYRSADRVARRQMRWVLFGIYIGALAPGFAIAMSALDPRLGWLWWASFWLSPLVPLSILVSVLRFNLFDVDRLLSATASYNILLVLLGAGALVVAPRVSAAVSDVA